MRVGDVDVAESASCEVIFISSSGYTISSSAIHAMAGLKSMAPGNRFSLTGSGTAAAVAAAVAEAVPLQKG
jgi:hypothetical protein